MQNFRKFRLGLLIGLFFLVLGFSQCALAGDIILNDLNGKAVNLSSCTGKPAILFFWTTWCPYCRQELKKLNQQYSQITQEGITVLGVNLSEPDYKVQKFLKGYPFSFRILLDKTGLLADKYGLLGVPTYIFLDKTGKVILRTHALPENYQSFFSR